MTMSTKITQSAREAEALALRLYELTISTFDQLLLIADELLEQHYDLVKYSDNWLDNRAGREAMPANMMSSRQWLTRLRYPNDVEMVTFGIFPHNQSRVFEAGYFSIKPLIDGIEVRFALIAEPIHLSLDAWSDSNATRSRNILQDLMEKGLTGIAERQKSEYNLARLAFSSFQVTLVQFVTVPGEYELGKSEPKTGHAAKNDKERTQEHTTSYRELIGALQRRGPGSMEGQKDDDGIE